MGESIKEREWKDIKIHSDSTFMSDMTGTRDKGVGTRDPGDVEAVASGR